jgi:hypothetical protein
VRVDIEGKRRTWQRVNGHDFVPTIDSLSERRPCQVEAPLELRAGQTRPAGEVLHRRRAVAAAVLVCMRHLALADPSLGRLATMPPGTVAWRPDRDDAWKFEEHAHPDE